MKKHLPSSIEILNANTFFKSVFTLLFLMLISNNVKAQTPVDATLQLPTIVSGCAENEYILKYQSTGSHALKIKAQLVNADTNCNSNILKPQVLFKIIASNYVNTFVFDTTDQSFTCNVIGSGSDTVYIQYKIFIDCSILQLDSSIASSVSLKQTFTEVSNTLTFSINNNTNVQTSSTINSPRLLLDQSTNLYSLNYLQPVALQFVYKNFSSVTANIGFKFFLEDTTFCSHGQTTGLFYSTDSISFSPVNSIGSTFVTINPNSKLFIRQDAMETNCIDTLCTTNKAHLQWHCNFDVTYNQLFCNNCLQEQIFPFNVKSDDHPIVKIIDNYPANFYADTSCFNDTLNMKTWQYTIVHDSASLGAADTLYTYILNSLQPAGKNLITLIPYSSIHFEVKSQHAIFIDTATTFYTNYLCKNFISDAILNFKINIAHFQKGDTLILSFKTFNCAEENDSALLGKGKCLNFWAVNCKALDICGNLIETEKKLNIEFTTGLASIQQELEFFPTVTHLNVPVNATFGDSVHLAVVLKRLQSIQYLEPSYQYLGCPYTTLPYVPCNNPQGILRVRFKFGLGLHIEQPLQRVFMQLDTGGTPINIFADYYNTAIPSGECDSGYYYFYFHFSDTLLFMLNNNGSLKSTITACCSAEPVTNMQIAFHFAPNPNSCFIVDYPTNFIDPPTFNKPIAFIPLSAVGQNFEIHCPGCKAPGIIVDRYVLKRVSYGLQDSNNNHFADDSLILITDTSTWYADHKDKLRENFSSYGDVLRDFTISHFQDGSNIPSATDSIIGYTYNEMLAHNAVLKYLQTSINIADTNSNKSWLTPLDYDFYIDEQTPVKNSCIDCGIFEVDTNFTTLVHLHIPSSLLTSFVQIVAGEGIYNYTFSSDSSSPFYIFSNPTLIQYQNAVNTFTAFAPDQRYRLTVHYNECLQFSNSASLPTIDDVKRDVDIDVAQWLTGLPQPLVDTGSTTPPMPNDTIRLHSANWTIDTLGYPTLDTINQLFANSYIFYCEFCGSPHYFFSQEANYSNSFTKDNLSNCEILMQTSTSSSTAANIFDPYPYEYRPPAYYPQQYRFKFPLGYSATMAFNYIYEYQIGGFHVSNLDTILLPPADSSGFITLPYDSLIHPVCLTESDAPNGIIPNGPPYIRDGLFYNFLNVFLQPDSCNAKTYFNNMDMGDAVISNIQLPCMTYGTCNDTAIQIPVDYDYAFSQKANLFTTINSLVQPIYTHHICTTMTITNADITIDSVWNGTGYTKIKTNLAPNVFMVTPNVNYLSNFSFTPTGGGTTVTANANGILQLATSLAPGATLTGTLCFDYEACQDSINVDFITGYNCNGLPDTPFVASNACFTQTNSLLITDATTQFGTDGKTEPVMFPRCKPFYKRINFYAANSGEAYPDSVSFINPPQGFEIISAAIFNGPNPTDTVLLDTTSTALNWIITTANLDSIGITSHNLNNNQLSILFLMEANCDAPDNFTSTHYIELHGHDFCNSYFVKQSPTTGNNFIYNDTSNCTDCFTVTKTVDKNPVNALDTVTYSIIVCANNGSSQTVYLEDILPIGFVPIDTLTTNFPIIVAQGCDTFKITGYFLTPADCPNTTDTARLSTFSNPPYKVLEATVCNTVMPECYQPNYIVIADNSWVSQLTNSYSNDTIVIVGTYNIDQSVTFTNCHIITSSGANIIAYGSNVLTLDNTTIEACNQMWRGIHLEEASIIKMNESRIADAENGVWARLHNGVMISNSQINNCITGVRLEAPNMLDTNVYNNAYGYIVNTNIGQTTLLKPSFNGQLMYGARPYACVFMSNVKFDIGSNSATPNSFHNASYGVYSTYSVTTIRNTAFSNIVTSYPFISKYNAAVTAYGEKKKVPSIVTLLPLANTASTTILNCDRGVYSYYTDITVRSTLMRGVNVGVSANHCKDLKKANINYNIIYSKFRGINFNNNEGANYCVAEGNYIYMSGHSNGKGINVNETKNLALSNYYISYNRIAMTNASNGITVLNAFKPIVTHNIINITTSIDTVSRGVSIEGCNQATVNCNTIKGSNPKDTVTGGAATQIGISNSLSNYSTIKCNSVDSTTWGIFFGGSCLATTFKGNDMYKHLHGLYLNSVAVIDSQSHAGNRWNDTLNVFNAVNRNDSTLQNLQQSLFKTDPNSGTVYNPSYPINNTIYPFADDQNWFKNDPGHSPWQCGQYTCTDITTRDNISDDVLRYIVHDSTITSDFVEESRAIYKNVAYDQFMQDSILAASDTAYQNFLTYNKFRTIGYLYRARLLLASISKYDVTFINGMTESDSLIHLIVDSLNYCDSLISVDSVNSYIEWRSSLIDELNTQIAISASLVEQHETDIANNAGEAGSENASATPVDSPEYNDRDMNDIEIAYYQQGISVIENNFSFIYSIASQCPYSGGPAVYKARAWLEQITDTLYYDDYNVCLTHGIFKQGHFVKNTNAQQVSILPNPTNGSIEIFMKPILGNKCALVIKNTIGSICYKQFLNCSAEYQQIDLSLLTNGVYFISVLSDNIVVDTKKLVLIK